MEDRWLPIAQGAYYLLTGLWPIVHMPSFLAVTGPKHDLWLVRTVGALVTAVGLSLLVAGFETELPRPVMVLGIASAVAFTLVDTIYVALRVISRVYLADATLQVLLIALWGLVLAR